MPNEIALAQLLPANRTTEVYAVLVDASNQAVFQFLYNPESKDFSRSAKYAEAPTAATSLPAQQYLYTTGRTLKLGSLLMQSYCEQKSLRKPLDDLQALMVANTQAGATAQSVTPTTGGQQAGAQVAAPTTANNYSPKQVYFVWGSERFGPAAITDLSWNETAWLDGEPAEARVDLTLLEIPPPDTAPSESAQPTPEEAAQQAGEVNLTERQREDARKAGDEWLQQNVNTLPQATRDMVRAKRYKWLTNAAGEVRIVGSNNDELSLLGTYDGTEFKPSEEATNAR